MPGILKKSLASWRDEHGFGLLCIHCPGGERFVVVPAVHDDPNLEDRSRWRGMSEADLRAHLAHMGLSNADIDEAVDLSRDWATTITASTSPLWPRSDSN